MRSAVPITTPLLFSSKTHLCRGLIGFAFVTLPHTSSMSASLGYAAIFGATVFFFSKSDSVCSADLAFATTFCGSTVGRTTTLVSGIHMAAVIVGHASDSLQPSNKISVGLRPRADRDTLTLCQGGQVMSTALPAIMSWWSSRSTKVAKQSKHSDQPDRFDVS